MGLSRQWAMFNRRIGAGLYALLSLAAYASGVSQPIQYQLDLRNPASHQVEVEMTVAAAWPGTEFQLPVWNNLYQIRDFARTVSDVTADCDGRREKPTRVDLDTWRAGPESCATLTLHYSAYVSGPTPFTSDVDDTHAFLNFASLLFYLPQERERAVHVKLLVPQGWKIGGLLEEDSSGFSAPNYDRLVDSPAEAGQFQEYSYDQGGATYRVIVHADTKDYSPERLLGSLGKITATETSLMRDVPFSRYTFIFHFPESAPGGGGMEHRDGTAITVRAREVHEHWEGVESVAAHEFFHLWNVKRIRPQLLEPIDYVHGNDTRDLWFSEGLTSTYGELALLRAGLISRKNFYTHVAEQISVLESRPARFFQSAEESGLEAWFEKYNDYFRPERSISYYNKGEVLGFLLDLGIRHATGNAAGLDDVMRRLNGEFARRGRYYTGADLERVVAEVAPAFSGLQAFFADYVRDTRELDYPAYLGYAGLQLESQGPGSARLGFAASLNPAGEVRVDYVERHSAAARAGLAQGDVLQKMNGRPLHESPAGMVSELKPGDEIQFDLLRDGAARKLAYRLESAAGTTFRLKEISNPSPDQLRIREGWLRGKTTGEQ